MTIAFVKYQSAIEVVFNAGHNFGADVFKFAFSNTAPNVSTHTQLSDFTEIAAGNGYTAGGNVVTITSATQTGGVLSVVPSGDVVFTATGGSIGPFRYVGFYNDTATNDEIISYYDYGTSITLLDTQSLTIGVGATLFTAS